MGGVGIGDVVNTVVGAAGAAGSMMAAKSQGDYLNQQLEAGNKQRGMVAGLDEYFLGGGKASGLSAPGFQSQFGEVDYAVQEQLRQIDGQTNKAKQMISDNIPNGGAKLRALADLAIQSEDARGKVVREAQSKKRDLDVQLTNQYLQQAMQRQPGPSQDARLWAVQQDYGNRVKDIGALGATLGTLADKVQYGQPQKGSDVQYLPQNSPTQQTTNPASTWNPSSGVLAPNFEEPSYNYGNKKPKDKYSDWQIG
jgi:hypothetical protein